VTGPSDLDGRTALVTGAGQNVGRAIVLGLAAAGARVLVNDVAPERAETVAAEVTAGGGTASAVPFDVTDWEAVSSATAGLDVDILVNNAGNIGVRPMTEMLQRFVESSPADWEPALRVNLYGVLHCTRALLPQMVERGWGRVVTVVSESARAGDAGIGAYAAAKAGAAGLMRALAREVGRDGVTCNCVALGTIDTTGQLETMDEEAARRRLRPYAVKRLGRAEDPAAMVVLLASDAASWITGQTVGVNGGYYMT